VTPPVLTPVRWWRDDETRYLSRPEYRAVLDRRRFNLSEVPRGDNPELDAFVEHWRDTIGFLHPDFVLPLSTIDYFAPTPEADPIGDVRWSLFGILAK
jgi:hypothetical protein